MFVDEGIPPPRLPIRGRLPRICPSTGWTYATYDIPPGATVSPSSYLMHYNVDVFPNPDVLDPERWLTTDEATLKLRERHFVSFSKGSAVYIHGIAQRLLLRR